MRKFRKPKKFNQGLVNNPEIRMDILMMKEVIESKEVYIKNDLDAGPICFEDYIDWLEE